MTPLCLIILSPVEALEVEINGNNKLPAVFENDNFSSNVTETWSISDSQVEEIKIYNI